MRKGKIILELEFEEEIDIGSFTECCFSLRKPETCFLRLPFLFSIMSLSLVPGCDGDHRNHEHRPMNLLLKPKCYSAIDYLLIQSLLLLMVVTFYQHLFETLLRPTFSYFCIIELPKVISTTRKGRFYHMETKVSM